MPSGDNFYRGNNELLSKILSSSQKNLFRENTTVLVYV